MISCAFRMIGAAEPRLARPMAIGVVVVTLAILAMVVDHLLGDDPGLEDPPAFLVSCTVVLVLAAFLFGRVVRRAAAEPVETRSARTAIVCAILGFLSLPLLFIGVPFVLGGGGVALGLLAYEGPSGRRAWVAIGLGTLVVLLGVLAYTIVAFDKLA